MLEEDLRPLEAPYAATESRQDGNYHLLRRWGIPLDELHQLEREILGDLDPDLLGIGWWVDHLPTRRRVLAGDHLVEYVENIHRNAVEAKMHLSSYIDARRELDSRFRYRLTTWGYEMKPAASPEEALADHVGEMHLAGLLRALGSVFDGLAAATIGVAGLDLSMKKAAWQKARTALRKAGGVPLDLDSIVAAEGPAGWDEWTLQMRNTWIHRPRRLQIMSITRLGEPGRKMRVHLPRSPDYSEVESLHQVDDLEYAQLAEEAEETVTGAFDSTMGLARTLGAELLNLWRRRRADPDWIRQPEGQWEDWRPDPSGTAFAGYVGDRPLRRGVIKEMMISSKAGERWEAAGLLGEDERRRFRDGD